MSLGWGPQYHPNTLSEWWLLGSPAQVEQPAAGPNGAVVGGTTFPQGYDYPNFGNSALFDANGEAVSYPSIYNERYGNAGAVEFFFYPNGWSITNGAASDGLTHYVFNEKDAASNNWFDFRFNAGAFKWRMRSGGGAWNDWVTNPPLMDALVNTWHHFAAVWDSTGIGGGANTQRLYWDNVMVASQNIAITLPIFADGNLGYLGNSHLSIALTRPAIARIDNAKWWNYAKTDFADSIAAEGYTPAPTPTIRAPECAVRRLPEIWVGGIDVTDHVRETPEIIEARSLATDSVFPDDCKVRCRNVGGLFSLENPRSILAGTNWQDTPVIIYDRWGVKVWDGLLSRPEVDDEKRITTLVSRSRLSRWKNARVVYTSAGAETPAAAFENICAAIGFTDYDVAALNASKALQTGMSIQVALLDSDATTFAQAINKLCIYGCADAYEHLGKIYYRAWQAPVAGTPAIILDEDDLLDEPKRLRSTQGLVNDYAIYEAATPSTLTDAGQGNIGAASRAMNGPMMLKDIAADADPLWVVQDVATGQTIGENWIRRTHSDNVLTQPRIQVQLKIRTEYRAFVDLTSDFGLTYSKENWTAKRFRVIAFTRDDDAREITVTGLEW